MGGVSRDVRSPRRLKPPVRLRAVAKPGRRTEGVELDRALVIALISLCVIAAVSTLAVAHGTSTIGFDFRGNEWEPARAVLHGHNPYHLVTRAYLVAHSNAFLLPPLVALLATPLAVLPFAYAFGIWTAASLFAYLAALLVVGLRDWRCYALACLSLPFVANIELGQLSAFLALGYALAWRYRDRRYLPGLIVAVMIALKLLAWPLLLWLAFTRRPRAAVVGVVTAPVLVAVSWAVIGFQGLRGFAHALAVDAGAFETRTHSVTAVVKTIGLSRQTGELTTIAVCFGLLALALVAAMRRDDIAAFAAATGAGIYGSPLVHPHYLLPVVIALAIARPRPTWEWLALTILWFSPREPVLATWRLDVAVACGLIIVLSLSRPARARTVVATERVHARVAATS